MSRLLIDVKLFPTGYWQGWPPSKSLEVNQYISLDGDTVKLAAEWCQKDIAHFILKAIEDRLSEVQAAMEEERAGTD